jgi:SPP1 family phage portal protein
MLNFADMETKRLSDIVNVGAGDKLNDKEFLERELSKWLNSKNRKLMITADAYYDYEQAIRFKKRLVIAEGGKMVNDAHLPNNRFLDNRYADMVDQKVNYLLSKPLTFKTENQAYADALKTVFDKTFYKTFKNLGKDTYNGGIGWLYPYYNERGEFCIRKFKPYEILPFWKDDDHAELDFAVRYYEMLGYEGHAEHVYRYVEVYDTKGIHRFTYDHGGLRPDYQTYYFERPDLDGELIPYNWDRVPLIPFKANNNETSLLKKCKSLQDGINDLLSNFGDGMQENASGNSILVLKNYGGTDLGEFRRNLAQYKAVKVTTVDGADGGVDTLQIEVNCQNYLTILSELRRALIHNCRGYDVEELKSAGSPNEMTIKSVYSQIDLDANELETEYQASFEQLLWFVNQHLANSGLGNFENETVEVIFDRDMMVNESQVIQDVNASSAILSKRTYLAQHPYVNDVEAELKELKKEQDEAMEQFGNSQFQKPLNGDEDEE